MWVASADSTVDISYCTYRLGIYIKSGVGGNTGCFILIVTALRGVVAGNDVVTMFVSFDGLAYSTFVVNCFGREEDL